MPGMEPRFTTNTLPAVYLWTLKDSYVDGHQFIFEIHYSRAQISQSAIRIIYLWSSLLSPQINYNPECTKYINSMLCRNTNNMGMMELESDLTIHVGRDWRNNRGFKVLAFYAADLG